jgi:hypothetical protein
MLPHEGFDLKGSIKKNKLFDRGFLTGGHTRENALLYINRAIRNENPNIVDVGASVLQLLDIDTDISDGTPFI